LILRFTTKVQALAWTFVWILAPFSAVFFPVSALPSWGQAIAHTIPLTYVFEEMRRQLAGETVRLDRLMVSLALNIVYLAASLFILSRAMRRTFQHGLAKIY